MIKFYLLISILLPLSLFAQENEEEIPIEEQRNKTEFTELGKKFIHQRLVQAETFERYLDKKFIGTKRYGLEGGEATVPGLEQIVKQACLAYKPSQVAQYLYKLSKSFNRFYAEVSVLHTKEEALKSARLELVESVSISLKKGLGLLGITPPEKM